MGMPEWDWKLQGGYADLIRSGSIETRLSGRTAKLIAGLSPAGLIRSTQPIDLEFSLSRPLRAHVGGGVVARLDPKGSLKVRVLFPGNAFLGNFRIQPKHYGVQWTVKATVETRGRLHGLARIMQEP